LGDHKDLERQIYTRKVLLQTAYLPVKSSVEVSPADLPVPIWNQWVGWAILIPLLYLAGDGNPVPTGTASVADVSGTSSSHKLILALVCALCSILIFNRLPSVFAICQRAKLIVALPLLALLSSAWSQNPRQTLVSASILLVFTVFALYVGSSFTAQGQFQLLILMAAVALPLTIALAVLVPSLGAPGGPWRGVFAHKQNCAASGTILLVTALHWKAFGAYQRIFRVSAVVMCCLLIAMSQSRTGWALAVVALCLSAALWLMKKTRPAEALLATMFVAATIVAIGYIVYNNAKLLLPAVGKDMTLSQRTIIWSAAWDTITQHPLLGYGYAAFWNGLQGASLHIVLIADWALAQAQNGFLDIWLQVGVGGIILTALIVGQAAWNGFRCFRAELHGDFVRWCLVIIACVLIYNIGESAVGMIQLVWFAFLLACIGLEETSRAIRTEAVLEAGELLSPEKVPAQEKDARVGWSPS
jgi:exopolysaccharide production protein ExoQ